MKLTVLFLLFNLIQLSANVYSQNTQFKLREKNISLKQAFNEIESQTDYRFAYRESFIDDNEMMDATSKNMSVEDFLEEVVKKMGYGYLVLEDNLVVITAKDDKLLVQELTVKGKITDNTGNPLPGVNIVEKGTTNGAVTNLDGEYFITLASSDATLSFSYVGFLTEEVDVTGRTTIDIVLIEDVQALEEVVVVGYGTQRKEAVTGSVASIRGDEMREVASSNITQAMQGRLPGVEMSRTSSKPGASMQIRIRGTRSLNASNDPLVVLDGVPFAGSIGDINPNDIKGIDILKDASATAIYGSRGANGVILVTTNKGQKGQKPKINYNGYYGTKKVFAKFPMMDGPEFVALRQAADQYTNGLDESDDVNTDWQDLLYRTGIVTSHDLGVSGGSEQGSYNFGFGYYHDEAVIPMQQYNRFSLRGTIDQEVGKFFRFGFTTNNNYNITEGSHVGYSITEDIDRGIYDILSMSPIADPYNEDGTWKRTIRMPLDEPWSYSKDILEEYEDKWLSETRAYGTYNTLYGEVKIPGVKGLKYRANVGLNFRQSNRGDYAAEGVQSTNSETPSTAAVANTYTYNWAVENLVTYDRTFNEKHQVNVVALYSAEQTKYNKSHIMAKDIPADAFQFYNLGRADGEFTIDPEKQDYQLSGLMSWMGRIMYSFDSRYMLTATLRSDGSSRLAEGHKWHTYPAVSAGWNIGNESFMQDISLVNMLKLRVGYGQTSNQSIDPYATLGLLNTRPYNFGDGFATGYYVSKLPNSNLGWEYSETWNYGLDFAVLNHRLSGTIEYYVTNTKDILLDVNLPNTSGVRSYTANIGETQNKGMELSLNGVILNNLNGWTWEVGINLYGNRNELVALASKQGKDENNWWFVGHPIDVIYDYEKIGLWQEGDPYLDILEPGGNVGMIKVKYTGEYNNDGTPVRQIGPEDRQIISLEPDFQGGFNTRVAYKGFDLSAIGTFKRGGTLISTLYSSSGYLNMLSGRRGNVDVDYWTPENTDAKYPKPGGITDGDNPKYGSTLGYFDASYLKIRTLSLGYNLGLNNWMKNAGIDKLRLYFTVQNPFVIFSPYNRESGMDPETNSYADQNAAVRLLGKNEDTSPALKRLLTIGTNTPSTRNYLFGINLTF